MTIEEAHYDFKIKMDRVDTISKPDFSVEEIDWLLNEAQQVFIKKRFNSSTDSLKLGFENTQKRIDDLSTLMVTQPLQPPIVPAFIEGVYELDLANLQYPYLFMVKLSAEITLNNCTKIVPLKPIQSDDLTDALRDPFNKPSLDSIPFNYGLSTSTNNTSIYMYPGSATINKVYPSYIYTPPRVNLGTYTYIDGVNYPPTTFSTPLHTHSEIVDIACLLTSIAIENPEYLRVKQAKLAYSE